MLHSPPQSRRTFLKATMLSSTLVLAHSHGTHGAAEMKPNIIFILADDLGYGDLGCYGQEQIATPNIDRMAAQGMRFTDHYSGSTVCAPSRATIMLGHHTGHLRTTGQGQSLLQEETTVAELLKEAGYATGIIGKWGVGQEGSEGVPLEQGFDLFVGYLNQRHAHNYYPAWIWRNEKKTTLNNTVVRAKKNGKVQEFGGASTERNDYSHDIFTEEALKFIEHHRGQPFFLYLPYTIPHANNEAERVVNRHGMEVPDYGDYKTEDWPEPQKGHAAMISRLDRDVGRILEQLKKLDLDENTIIFFSSDNGPHREGGADPAFFDANGPLRGIKRDFYEGGIRVPMVVRWPGRIPPGRVSNHISAFWDFLPTCTELAGIPQPDGIDGISFLPTLIGKPQETHEFMFWEFKNKRAIRMNSWKAVQLDFKTGSPVQLFNLAEDIGEQKDLSAQHPDLVTRFTELMDSAMDHPSAGVQTAQ